MSGKMGIGSVSDIYGLEKVTGASYTYDLSLPNMLWIGLKRSPLPHALIRSIDKSRAESLKGVVAVVTAEDVPKGLHGRGLLDTPILARGKVRYVGEPVAAVAAESIDLALAAVELIEVDYEPLPALFNVKDALSNKPPIVVHENASSYKRLRSKLYRVVHDPSRPNVSAFQKIRFGDVEEAFKEADFVISNTYTTPPVQHAQLEPTSIIGKQLPDGSITIYTSGQTPFRTRKEIADALEMSEQKIRVIVPKHVGGGFGNRGAAVYEPIVAALALKTKGRPVKLTLTRLEDLMYTTVRHQALIEVSDAVSKDGRILGRAMTIIYNGGAYSVAGNVVVRNSIYSISAVYRIPNIKADIYRVYTNQVQGGAFRGFGSPQIYWAIESQIDEIARKLNMDPLDLRLKNVLRDGDVSCIGEKIEDDTMDLCINKLKEITAANPKPPATKDCWITGRGFAIAKHQCDVTYPSIALIRLNEDLTVDLYIGATDIGQGTFTGLAQIVSEQFNIPLSKVRIISSDTLITPLSSGSSGSRQLVQLGNAVLAACDDLKKQIVEVAARILKKSKDKISFSKGLLKLEDSGRKIRLEEIFTPGPMGGAYVEHSGLLLGKGFFFEDLAEIDPETGRASKTKVALDYTPIAALVDVAVDPETGSVKVLCIKVVADVGKAINRALVEGQLIGGAWMGFSTALFEELVIKEGQILTGTFTDYLIPTTVDSPNIEATILESGKGPGPFGSRSVGELGVLPIAPAIGNAIRDAVGVRVTSLPITPEKLFRLLKNKLTT
jgi:CO/xanthine dehydrogenase Mo-binding subunit